MNRENGLLIKLNGIHLAWVPMALGYMKSGMTVNLSCYILCAKVTLMGKTWEYSHSETDKHHDI